MTNAKAVNYTTEQTATVKALYANGTTVEAIAATVGKSVRSIVAKLSREGVYTKKVYTTKTGGTVVASKEKIVAQIANVIGVDADSLAGLEKANKTTLDAILRFMVAE